jgi:hypothetical protein
VPATEDTDQNELEDLSFSDDSALNLIENSVTCFRCLMNCWFYFTASSN